MLILIQKSLFLEDDSISLHPARGPVLMDVYNFNKYDPAFPTSNVFHA